MVAEENRVVRRVDVRYFTRRVSRCFGLILGLFNVSHAQAQERPYFVTYDHYLEEPGNLEIEYFSTFATQRQGNNIRTRQS